MRIHNSAILPRIQRGARLSGAATMQSPRGALLMSRLFHNELELYAFVGLIMLFGLLKKAAIMMMLR